VYYSHRYRECSDAAWADNQICKDNCSRYGAGEECYFQCDNETRNAVESCEWSYRRTWNCGFGPAWPPVGVIIRIP
jgi:hypothetical protein